TSIAPREQTAPTGAAGSVLGGAAERSPERCARELPPGDVLDAAAAIDIERLREADQAELGGDRALRVHHDVWHAVHAQEMSRIAGQIVDVHADEDDAPALRPGRRGEESRFALARRAPG